MGVADRNYMRGRGAGFLDRTSWTVRLIVVVTVGFFLQHIARGWFGTPVEPWFAVSPPAVLSGRIWTPVTYALLHADFGHLLWNMVGLYFFGRMTEGMVGGAFLRFCVAATVLSALFHVVFGLVLSDPTAAIGASGVVAATLVFAALRRPHTRVRLLLLPFFAIPLWLIAGLWVAGSLLGVARGSGEAVAHAAHLGGAVYGALAFRFGVLPPAITFSSGARKAPRAPELDEAAARARVDRLLAKISEHGIGSLTDAEREFLNDASRRYR